MQGGLRAGSAAGAAGALCPEAPVGPADRASLCFPLGKAARIGHKRGLATTLLTFLMRRPSRFPAAPSRRPGDALLHDCPPGKAAMRRTRRRSGKAVEIIVICLKNHSLVTTWHIRGRREKMAFLAVFTRLSHHALSRLQNKERPLVSRGFAVPRRTPPYLLTQASVTKTLVRRRASGAAGQGKIVTQGRFQVLRSEVVSLPRN